MRNLLGISVLINVALLVVLMKPTQPVTQAAETKSLEALMLEGAQKKLAECYDEKAEIYIQWGASLDAAAARSAALVQQAQMPLAVQSRLERELTRYFAEQNRAASRLRYGLPPY